MRVTSRLTIVRDVGNELQMIRGGNVLVGGVLVRTTRHAGRLAVSAALTG